MGGGGGGDFMHSAECCGNVGLGWVSSVSKNSWLASNLNGFLKRTPRQETTGGINYGSYAMAMYFQQVRP